MIFSGLTFGFIAAMALARWLREENDIVGLRATLLVFVIPFAFWLVASHELPNRALDWRDLVPGATVLAVGLQAMHVFTVYFLERKLLNATELCGVIGVTTTVLFWSTSPPVCSSSPQRWNASLSEHRITQSVVSPG
ncbi:MAG TPA: hypothetical protein VFG93_01960 [Gaiellaceae bacterium]|nr:hypothetical protein [Gaiellaceae bacterium]